MKSEVSSTVSDDELLSLDTRKSSSDGPGTTR